MTAEDVLFGAEQEEVVAAAVPEVTANCALTVCEGVRVWHVDYVSCVLGMVGSQLFDVAWLGAVLDCMWLAVGYAAFCVDVWLAVRLQ